MDDPKKIHKHITGAEGIRMKKILLEGRGNKEGDGMGGAGKKGLIVRWS